MNKLNCIIYKVQPYGETGRLLQCYSSKGKISLLAKGSQKLNSDLRIMSQYLTEISFDFKTFKTFLPLINGKLVNDYKELKTSYISTKYASVMLELISKIYLDEVYHEKIYSLITQALNSNNIQESSISFAFKLSYYLGYGLDLKGNGKKVVGFSLSKGGVVYDDEDYRLDLNYDDTLTLYKITYSNLNDLEKMEQEKIDMFKELLFRFYYNKIDINLKTLK